MESFLERKLKMAKWYNGQLANLMLQTKPGGDDGFTTLSGSSDHGNEFGRIPEGRTASTPTVAGARHQAW
jgi:hypothetical protein